MLSLALAPDTGELQFYLTSFDSIRVLFTERSTSLTRASCTEPFPSKEFCVIVPLNGEWKPILRRTGHGFL